MTAIGPGPDHSYMHFLTFIMQTLKLNIRQSCSGNIVLCTTKNLLCYCIVLQIDYSGIIVVLFNFYKKIITHMQILSTLYQFDLTSMFKIIAMCVKCWLNRTYSISTLNCTCLALIMSVMPEKFLTNLCIA
jgi:hypothetical protein